jgi:hypothetical protein
VEFRSNGRCGRIIEGENQKTIWVDALLDAGEDSVYERLSLTSTGGSDDADRMMGSINDVLLVGVGIGNICCNCVSDIRWCVG